MVLYSTVYNKTQYIFHITYQDPSKDYVERRILVRNPPPYCLSLPFLKEYAAICLRIRNLTFRQTTVDGCLELDAELYHVHVATAHLGCFSIPI
ncbi:unnamed protein product [Onchocerca ochengi]|uniref:DUF4773 domain-containing protein n=1 Tax=Onchocerca ochengi TaxID=42157 RepID=A0A182EKE5_ONCOC|nr:unnamed protein product [Onchocerca ochengi]